MGRFDALLQATTTKEQVTTQKPQVSPTEEPRPQKTEASNLHASMQTSKPVNTQTSIPVNKQTSKQVNMQTGKHAIIVKYSTYLTPECKKGLQRIAFETDRKDYDVLIEAVEQYLERNKRPK